MPPKVSVLMAVYNGAAYLAEAVESILAQTMPDFEFIIVDDGSTDATPAILDAYTDGRIVRLRNAANLGLTRSLNIGLQAAGGDYIARQDADDIALPGRLAESLAFLESHPAVALVSGEIDIIDEAGRLLGRQQRAASPALVRWYMLFYNHIGGHSQVMFRRRAALEVGGYPSDRPTAQDYALWLRLMEAGDAVVLARPWLKFRRHGGSVSAQRRPEQEKFSLLESQRALADWLGLDFDLEQVAALRGFWLEPFPPSQQLGATQAQLRAIYRAFRATNPLTPAENRTLCRAVAGRFMAWARSVSLRRHPSPKLRLWRFALAWSRYA